jgi:hypothetical protein
VASCRYRSLSLELQTFPHVVIADCEQDPNNALGVRSSLCRIDGERVGSTASLSPPLSCAHCSGIYIAMADSYTAPAEAAVREVEEAVVVRIEGGESARTCVSTQVESGVEKPSRSNCHFATGDTGSP